MVLFAWSRASINARFSLALICIKFLLTAGMVQGGREESNRKEEERLLFLIKRVYPLATNAVVIPVLVFW